MVSKEYYFGVKKKEESNFQISDQIHTQRKVADDLFKQIGSETYILDQDRENGSNLAMVNTKKTCVSSIDNTKNFDIRRKPSECKKVEKGNIYDLQKNIEMKINSLEKWLEK
ncbi:hypothetical protein RF11_16069 [Thelohanellus kitauei]|uniref:Uncharacterized protein n=1 Tax=Thelohanellus kitauei TaxID=669202 RepID=A0A0C2MMU0_THEKT|nr:hypothetical protein RF11_16069 [Thelohanellus kitauei]